MLWAHSVMTVTQSGLGLLVSGSSANCPGHSIGCQKAWPSESTDGLAAQTHGHINSAGCEGMVTTVKAAHLEAPV